jgi:probable HAF family extracellular repeat protein
MEARRNGESRPPRHRRPVMVVAAATALATIPAVAATAAVPDVPGAPTATAAGWEQQPGTLSSATDLNDGGQVVGMDGSHRGVLWDAATGVTRLIDPLPGSSIAIPEAINRPGQVAGQSLTPPSFQHAYRWSPDGTTVDLGTIAGDYSYSHDINDAGHVVGVSSTATTNVHHAFWWTPTAGMVDLGTLPGGTGSYASAVNSSDTVVGRADFGPEGPYRAFVWTRAGGMIDLGTLGGTVSDARAVNNRGEVAGMATAADGSGHLFRWTKESGMVDLGRIGYSTEATAIDEAGTIVGTWRWSTADGPADRAFRWTPTAGFEDLGLPAADDGSSWPTAVNVHGTIVGTLLESAQGGYRAFIWRPGADPRPQPRPTPAPRPVAVPARPKFTG